jgi:hypothetical protein
MCRYNVRMTYPSAEQLELIYAERQTRLAELYAKGEITAADLQTVDRLGRCAIANDAWAMCSADSQRLLLLDLHPHVRSCAAVSQARQTAPSVELQ